MKKSKRIIPFRYKRYPQTVDYKNCDIFEELNAILLNIQTNSHLNNINEVYLNNE